MAGGDTPKRPPDKEKGVSSSLPAVEESNTFSDVSLSDAPILLLVYFHKAMREELSQLYSLAVLASKIITACTDDSVNNNKRHELIVELRRRFDFLKLVQTYHAAVEDEVIFLALDEHIKNVVQSYALEHDRIAEDFGSVFRCLSTLDESEAKDNNHGSKQALFQELLSCIATMDSSISNHMFKEEKHVFPLLMEHFCSKEQALLMWQFFCSIPVILLEEMLPWMICLLTPEQRVDFTRCIKEVAPQEILLQEVVVSWLHKNDQSSSEAFTKIANEPHDGPTYIKGLPHSLREGKKTCHVPTNAVNDVADCLHLWHRAIQKDLKEILEEASESKIFFSDMDSIVVRLKFLADVVTFYSYALKKFFYPVLNEPGNDHPSTCSTEQFLVESRIESLHKLLQCNAQNSLSLSKFIEKLCQELKSLVMDVSKQFHFQEIEVFPLIMKKCSKDAQQQLLYMSLHLMPLGLLKCVAHWFAAHLSENESRPFLHGRNYGDKLSNSSFASLLLEWFRIGYSGKTSIGKKLHKTFSSRCSFLPEQIKEVVGKSPLLSNVHFPKESKPSTTELLSSNKGKMLLSDSCPDSCKAEMYGEFYASEINRHIFFPSTKRLLNPFSPAESSAILVTNEPKPIDLIFFFHKALKKDLDYLVSGSSRLAENIGYLTEFSQHFHHFWLHHQFHSETEDEIAFPALEAKKDVQNISCTYSMDHKLESEYFNDISLMLDKMSKLHTSLSSADSSILAHTVAKYNSLSTKLRHRCELMHKLVCDHIHHEELQLWPLFRQFSIQEQEKIMGLMLGKVGAESLQNMIIWLIGSLTPEEQQVMMSLWRNVTKNTMFDEWLGEWLEGYGASPVAEDSNTLPTADPLDIISSYLSKDARREQDDIICDEGIKFSQKDASAANTDMFGECNLDDKGKVATEDPNNGCSECGKLLAEGKTKRFNEVVNIGDEMGKPEPGKPFQSNTKLGQHGHLLTMTQEDLESAIRRASRDSSLDPQKKSYIIQNLTMSRWIVQQRISRSNTTINGNEDDIPGRHPSYHDDKKVVWGCKHYKRSCKLVTDCCSKIYTCIYCHNEEADHVTDRRKITKMMCMKCLAIQPIGQTCSTASCNNLFMAKYYCSICKLFDDGREIYHCPYCNICRLGKGLGINYFHCMNCNACMSTSLLVHVCREKCLEKNCPICHEDIFTSTNPAKSLPCGHMMHSTCFRDYTCTQYTCPICSKSLGDMRVYFKMLDALMAEEKMPDDYSDRTQVILCNDCEKKGDAPYHWHYHKCATCGSYNTRLL